MSSTEGSRLPVHARERIMVRVLGGFAEMSVETFVPRSAARATVFCIHDFLGTGADFRPFAGFLALHRYRVVCPDMLGRGASAHLSKPAYYRAQAYLGSLMSLMEHFTDKHIMIVAKGWGGLLALLLIRHFKFDLKRFVLADLPLTWTVARDKAAWAAAEGPAFTSLEHARRALSASAEFRTLSTAAANAIIDTRIARSGDGFVVNFDPTILAAAAKYDNRVLDTGPLLQTVNSWLLHLSSDPLSQGDRERLAALLVERPNQSFADGLAVGGRIQFDTAHQRLLTLGFLGARLMPTGI